MLQKQALLKSHPLKYSALGMLLVLLGALQPASAQTVLDKVAKTGILTAGTSKDAFPLAYADDKGQLMGYSVDMIQLVKAQIEKELKRPVTVKLVALTPGERIPKLQSGEVDLICDSSSFTWERDKLVDFSVSYGLTGTRLLVKRGTTFAEPASLVGKRIGALPKTTNEDAIRRAQPKAQIVLFKDRAEGYKALQEGKIDGFSGDNLILKGWLQKTSNTTLQVDGYPYSKEGIACMVPENNSQLLNKTNYALLSFMQGFIKSKPASVSIFDRWFGFQGAMPLTQDLRDLVKDGMQTILDLHEEIPGNDL
jgi:polar amino acid transport system substrate-binding protein